MSTELYKTESNAPVRVHTKTWLVVAACNIAYFAQLLALVGSGFLAQDIGALFGSTHQAVWLSSVITIFTVVLGPPVGQVADLWGRKWPLVIALALGAVGSVVASRAKSMGTVIAGFTIMACCYGAQPLIHAVVSEVLPRKQRPIAQASINITAGIGAFIGICIGGALLRNGVFTNYRIYLYVSAAVFAMSALGVGLGYNPPPRDLQTSLTTREKLGRLDWIGYVIFAPGLVLFCVALSWSKNPYPWSNSRIIGTFVVGIVLMAALAVYEWRFKKNGLLHHGLFRQGRNFPIALTVVFAEGLAFFALNAYFIFEVSVFTGANLLNAGLHYGLTFLVATLFAGVGGVWSKKAKAIRWPLFTGFAFLLIFFICMATSQPSTPHAALWVFAVLPGIGIGIILPIVMVAAQLSTPPDLIAEASALVLATRALGGTVGLAINNAVFSSTLATQIPQKIASAVLPLRLPITSLGLLIEALTAQDEALLAKVPGISPQIIGAAAGALTDAYAIGFRYCWITSLSFVAVALLASVFFSDPKEEFNAHIDAPAEAKLIEEQAVLESERTRDAKHAGAEHIEVVEKHQREPRQTAP